MSQLLVVFGATGFQGKSAINFVQQDPELSKQFKIRAVTRDPSQPASVALSKSGVEVVSADLTSLQSVSETVAGASFVYGMTATVYDEVKGYGAEVRQGRNIVDATHKAGAYLIWSSAVAIKMLSGGVLPNCHVFDTKADVEAYVRTLPMRAAFVRPGSFMQNFLTQSKPKPQGDGTYAIANIAPADHPMPQIDSESDTGKWVGAVLAQPDKYEGKAFAAASGFWTWAQLADAISAATGKTVKYKQVPDHVFKGFMPAPCQQSMLEMFQWYRDFGYYGDDSAGKVKWAVENARGKLTTFEEFLQKNPISLD